MRSLAFVLVAGLSAASLVLGVSRAADAQALTKITAGTVSPSAQQWPEYIAQEFGWFKEAGIDFDLLNVGNTAAQQVVAGSINIGHSGFPDFIRATDQGAPIKIVVNDIGVPPYNLYGKPELKGLADLKGKTVSIGGPKDITLIFLKTMLASVNLKPSDVDLTYAKATGDRLAALAAHAVDASILIPPSSFHAAALGFRNLGDIETYTGEFPFTVWAANNDWAAKNRDALVAFVKTYTRAARWLYDPSNKAKAVDILLKYAGGDRSDAEQTYDYLVTKLRFFVLDGKLSDATYKKMTAGLAEINGISVPTPPKDKFFDSSFVDAAAK